MQGRVSPGSLAVLDMPCVYLRSCSLWELGSSEDVRVFDDYKAASAAAADDDEDDNTNNDIYYSLCTYYMRVILNGSHIRSNTTLGERGCYCPYFTNAETEP